MSIACGRVDDVDYYNDSKGTNVDAAVIAIKALRDGIILIAGGDGKGQDFEDLVNHFEGSVEALILLSPACASWDMYANFEQRGRHFKQCINEMLK